MDTQGVLDLSLDSRLLDLIIGGFPPSALEQPLEQLDLTSLQPYPANKPKHYVITANAERLVVPTAKAPGWFSWFASNSTTSTLPTVSPQVRRIGQLAEYIKQHAGAELHVVLTHEDRFHGTYNSHLTKQALDHLVQQLADENASAVHVIVVGKECKYPNESCAQHRCRCAFSEQSQKLVKALLNTWENLM
jgi:hypothetical protein